MLSTKFTCARARNLLNLTAFAVAAFASANASAGLLEKLLAPEVGKKPGFAEGKKNYNEDVLKPDDLKSCLVKAHDIDEQSLTKPDTTASDQERDKLVQEGKDLAAIIAATKDKPVEEEEAKKMNARTAAYMEKQKEFNERANGANAKNQERSKAFNAAFNEYRESCSGMRYYRSDLEAVKPKLPFDIDGILQGKK